MTTNNQNIQAIKKEIEELLDEAKKVNKEIDETNKTAKNKLSDIYGQVNKSISKAEKIFADLDKVDKEAGDKLDTLILKQVKDSVG